MRRIWNGPGVLIIAIAVVVLLVIGMALQYREGEKSADDFGACLMAARSQAEMDRC